MLAMGATNSRIIVKSEANFSVLVFHLEVLMLCEFILRDQNHHFLGTPEQQHANMSGNNVELRGQTFMKKLGQIARPLVRSIS